MMRESRTRKLGQRACRKESGTRIVRVERGGEGVRAKVRLGEGGQNKAANVKQYKLYGLKTNVSIVPLYSSGFLFYANIGVSMVRSS